MAEKSTEDILREKVRQLEQEITGLRREIASLSRDVQETIPERTKKEQREQSQSSLLFEAQKMDAIANLAGGIAHQFNNALSGIIGNIELLRMDFPENRTVEKYVDPMKRSVRKMAQLTTQLLAYARGGKYQPRTLLLNEFIRDTLPLIQPTMGDAVHIETDVADYVWGVRADTAQMQMVLSAILANASEAMEGSGRIHIRCRNDRIGKGSEEDRPIPTPGPYVRLTIQDDGQGMKKEVLDRVFEPFFTTKFQGRGLGLAAVYGIVTNHGGWITIDSKRGKGTRVGILLPAVEVDEKTVPAEKESSGPSTGTVLIVEDEELVMEVNSGLLRRLGHWVLEARTGREALRIADSHEGNIDVVLLDIVLPDMGGVELYSRLMKARPGLKVVVCSGYAMDGPARAVLDAGADDFLQKPFSMAGLSDALQNLMPSNSV